MNTADVTSQTLASSVISVPPLARNADFTLNVEANRQMARHLEAGGVSTLLYGGNAILYHVRPSEYAALLKMLSDIAGENSLVVPSVGPAYGTMMDQAEILREFEFPTAMILPTRDVVTSAGVARAVQDFVKVSGRPAVLYIKHDGFVDVDTVKRLNDDGLISWIKYAIVRDDPAQDEYLRELVQVVDPAKIVSGIGEQPAIAHMQGFGVVGFTSGCVCVAPKLSMSMLRAIQTGDLGTAEEIRSTFRPLEDLRNSINPVRVLHTAVRLAGIADTGPLLPLLSEVSDTDLPAIEAAATTLLDADRNA